VHAQLTGQVLATTEAGADASARVAAWEAGDGDAIRRASETFEEICGDETADLARMSVALRVVRSLLEAS
jgi:glutamate dehydrogenase